MQPSNCWSDSRRKTHEDWLSILQLSNFNSSRRAYCSCCYADGKPHYDISLSHLGGRRMKRRTKTKFTQIHVSIPVRTLEDLDETLSFKQSRSRVITKLVENYLEGDQIHIGSMTKRQICINLINQTDPESSEYVLLTSLLQILSK